MHIAVSRTDLSLQQQPAAADSRHLLGIGARVGLKWDDESSESKSRDPRSVSVPDPSRPHVAYRDADALHLHII